MIQSTRDPLIAFKKSGALHVYVPFAVYEDSIVS